MSLNSWECNLNNNGDVKNILLSLLSSNRKSGIKYRNKEDDKDSELLEK